MVDMGATGCVTKLGNGVQHGRIKATDAHMHCTGGPALQCSLVVAGMQSQCPGH